MAMETEFYHSQTESLPTFSLFLAVSLAGLNTVAGNIPAGLLHEPIGSVMTVPSQYAYYKTSVKALESEEQLAALRHFAEKLLTDTEDSPQAVVDVLNRNFWNLV
jgi:hypothetical protein